ncbi:MAG: Crp/Fnr family transcriptional regulator [Caulobacterales bacterium]
MLAVEDLVEVGMAPEAAARVIAIGRPVALARQDHAFEAGSACAGYIVTVAGAIDVVLLAENGREIALYSVGPGELCVQTMQCLASGGTYSAEGRVREPVRGVLITPAAFDALMRENDAFRAFVMVQVAERFSAMMHVVEQAMSTPLPRRIAGLLVDRAIGDVVTTTHAEIAVACASSREGVTRALSAMARDGAVRIERGRIVLVDRDALSRLATGSV